MNTIGPGGSNEDRNGRYRQTTDGNNHELYVKASSPPFR